MKCDPNSVKFTQKMGVPSSWSRHLSLKTNTLTNREERITKKHTCYVKNLSCLPWQSCKHQSSFIGWNTSIPLCMRVEIINSQPHTTISCNVEYPLLTMYYRLYYSTPTWQVLTQLFNCTNGSRVQYLFHQFQSGTKRHMIFWNPSSEQWSTLFLSVL